MRPAVVVRDLGKQFLRYHAARPATFHEAVLSGWKNMRARDRMWAVRDINFTLLPGQMLGIIGSNGAGKSTLLKLIGGVIKKDEGTIERNGRIGALLNLGGTFHTDLTGRENVCISGVVAGLTRAQVANRLESIVSFAEAESIIDNPVRTYSTGMQMRLAFSVAIHTDADILLVDEHLSVGDRDFEAKCLAQITKLQNDGCAILLISHKMEKIADYCDRTLWLQNGKVRAYGPTDDVLSEYTAPPKTATSSPEVIRATAANLSHALMANAR